MNSEKKVGGLKGRYIIITLAVILVIHFTINYLTDRRFNDLEAATRVQIAEQRALLLTIAETTARNGADSVTESIVRDCTGDERVQFDSLLGRLNDGLSKSELIELERLFGRCGGFYSERKSMMVARLSREIEIYDYFVKQLSVITDEDQSETYKVAGWESLATEERKQSELFSRLVLLQDQIISTLLAGKAANSEEIIAILSEVSETKDTLQVTNLQVSSVRGGLAPL